MSIGLVYAPHRKRFKISYIFVILFSLGGMLWIALYSKPILARYRLLELQSQCANHSMPPKTLVFEGFPPSFDKLLSTQPNELKHISAGVGRPDPLWCRLQQELGLPLLPEATLLLHELKSGNNDPRIVCIDLIDYPRMRFTVVEHATPFRAVKILRSGNVDIDPDTAYVFQFARLFSDGPTFFAGQFDLNDRSKFTIEFVIYGVHTKLEGSLTQDDLVTIRLQDIAGLRKSLRNKGVTSMRENG